MSLTCFSHQLDSKKNGPVLLFKTIIRCENFSPSSFATDGKDRDGFKFEKVGLPFPSRALLAKINKNYYGQCSLIDIFFIILRDTTGAFYVWVKTLIMTLAQNGPKKQYPCNIILL